MSIETKSIQIKELEINSNKRILLEMDSNKRISLEMNSNKRILIINELE